MPAWGVVSRAVRRAQGRPVTRILLGSLVGQGVVIGVSPLITRLYTPGDLGALAVLTGISAVLGVVSTLGWERALVLPRTESAARALVLLAILSGLVVVAAVALASFALRVELATWFGAPTLETAWWLLPLTVLAIASQRILSAVLARRRAYGQMAVRNALQGIGQVVANLTLAPLGGGLGLLVGLAAGRAAGIVGLGAANRRSRLATREGADNEAEARRRRRITLSARLVRAVAFRYRRFPLVSTWSGLLNVAGQQAPMLVLTASYGAGAVGLVALTIRVLAAPVGIVADAVAQYFEGHVGHLVRTRSTGLRRTVLSLVARLAIVGGAGAIVVLVLGPALFGVVFGSEWSEAGRFAQILVPAYAAQIVVSPLSRLLPLLERQGVQVAWDVGRLIVTIGSVIAGVTLGLGIGVTLTGFASASCVAYAVLLVLVVRASPR
ncbi:lipopolysaccharide biosynthesis protein [Frigoribacterium sp. 2-23]|uniref:lipopolysaccharide biosynthesis protein n=1 Tax=Frigoribacterium sp. 2-23 TaxID=3415006 RepID=UPI003C7061A0